MWLEVAAADHLWQVGFDETKIDGLSTHNFWVRLPDRRRGGDVTLYPECAKTLVGGTADKVNLHIKELFVRGQATVMRIRAALKNQGMSDQEVDNHAPLVDGGVQMHKIRSTTHDTCATANATARGVARAKQASGKAFFGEEAWSKLPEEEKGTLDVLCANHTRQLPCAEYERLSDKELCVLLRDQKKALEGVLGNKCRLELKGQSLVRSVAKLVHRGFGCYAKGDGQRFLMFVQRELRGQTADIKMGRCETGTRQDGPFKLAYLTVALLPEIKLYTQESLKWEQNILRDSVFMRIHALEFEADLVTRAIVYDVLLEPLIFITNSNDMKIDPLLFAGIYDQIWNMAELLKSEDALKVFGDTYSPFDLDGDSGDIFQAWLAQRDQKEVQLCSKEPTTGAPSAGSRVDDSSPRILLRQHIRRRMCKLESRPDWADFRPLLLRFLGLFGDATQVSLKRTCSDYLRETNGQFSTANAQPWMKVISVHCLVHNNAGERPFGVVKHYKLRFKRMRTETAGSVATSNVNHTFLQEPGSHKYKRKRTDTCPQEGAYWQADPALQDALFTQAVEGRKRRRETEDKDREDQQEFEAERIEDETAKRQKLAVSKLLKQNTACELELLQSEEDMEDCLSALRSATSRVAALKEQVNGRIGRDWQYTSLAPQFLNGARVRLSPKEGKGVKMELNHLQALLKAMIAIDVQDRNYEKAVEEVDTTSVNRRQLPVLGTASSDYQTYQELATRESQAAVEGILVDDPELLELEAKYLNQQFVDTESRQYLRVVNIAWLEDWDAFAAGCVELNEDSQIPLESRTAGGKVKETALEFYGLTLEDQEELDKLIAQSC